jgi:hypothetical protein
MCVTIEIYARRRRVPFVCLFDLFDHIRLVEVSTEFVMDPYSINVQHGSMFIDN